MDLRQAIILAQQQGATHFASGKDGTMFAYRPAQSVERCEDVDQWARLEFILSNGEYLSTVRWVFSALDPAATPIL